MLCSKQLIIESVDIMNKSELSFAQKTLWYEWLKNPQGTYYTINIEYNLNGPLDIKKINHALNESIKRFDALRAYIVEENSTPNQVFENELEQKFKKINCEGIDEANIKRQKIISVPLNIIKPPVSQYFIIEYGVNQYILIIRLHHIFCDDTSIYMFTKYLSQTYNNISNTDSNLLSSDSFLNYIYNEQQARLNEIDYWKEKFKTLEYLHNALNSNSVVHNIHEGKRKKFLLNKNLSHRIRDFSVTHNTSVFNVILASFKIFINKYFHNSNALVLYPANMRPKDNKNLEYFGFGVNVMPFIKNIEENNSFVEIVHSIAKQRKFENKFRCVNLLEILTQEVNTSYSNLYDWVISEISFSQSLDLKNISSKSIEQNFQESVGNFGLYYSKDQINIECAFEYKVSMFSQHLVDKLVDYFTYMLETLLQFPEKNISELSLLSEKEKQKILYDWNKTFIEYPPYKSLHNLFEKQAIKTPYNTALIFEEKEITYKDLDQRSTELASYLYNNYKITTNTLIGICMDKCENAIIGILAILKSGAAYVPIDPHYPDERTKYIIDDANIKLILTNSKYQNKLKQFLPDQAIISIDNEDFLESIKEYELSNLDAIVSSNDLAYVIYTSGTSGRPKGVMIEHKGIINRIIWMNNEYPVSATDRILQKTPFTFDVSLWEIFLPISFGATLVLSRSDDNKDVLKIINLIIDNKISYIHFVPSMLSVIVMYLIGANTKLINQMAQSLKHLFCSGEELKINDVKEIIRIFPDIQFHNLYGPTEASVDVLFYYCNKEDNKVLIGKQIANTTAYILDKNLKPMPIGSIGDLYIGGVGLARGYLNNDVLTKKKFIPNLYQSADDKIKNLNSIIYHTGDLARWMPDGNIDYIGRDDFQVKIRGYRIELKEIEAVLIEYKGIQQAAVLVEDLYDDKGEVISKKLIGYYVAKKKLDDNKILNYLERNLPEYMVPKSLVYMDEFPITSHGKLDRKTLQEYSVLRSSSKKRDFLAPAGDLQIGMCRVWSETLQIKADKISVNDNFFRLGGDSILAIRLVNNIKKHLGYELSVADLYKSKSLLEMLKYIKLADNSSIKDSYKPFSLVRSDEFFLNKDVDDIYPASYLQTGMIIESLIDKTTYHDVFIYPINSVFKEDKFVSAWKILTARHELLRAEFIISKDDIWHVVINSNLCIDYKIFTAKDSKSKMKEEILNYFDVKASPLFRLKVNVLTNNTFDLIVSYHHVIAEGWSIASLISEFLDIYNQNIEVEKLIPIKISYGEFVKNELSIAEDVSQVDFWKLYLNEFKPNGISWKFDSARSNEGRYIAKFDLHNKYVPLCFELSRKHDISIDSIFLYVLIKTISFFTKDIDLAVGFVVHNRLEKEDGDKIFGLFLNTIPFRYKINPDLDDLECIKQIFETKLQLQKYQFFPYAKIKSIFNQDLFNIVFNYTHFHILESSQNSMRFVEGFEKTNIPIVFNISQYGKEGFSVKINAHDNFVSEEYVSYFLSYFEKFLYEFLDNNKINYRLKDEDYNKLTSKLNATDKNFYNQDNTIHDLVINGKFNENNIAIVDSSKNKNFTYKQLLIESDLLAKYLYLSSSKEANIGLLIAVLSEKGYNQVVSTISIMASGHAYLPLNTDWPADRIIDILTQGFVKTILISREISKNTDLIGKISYKYNLVIIEDILEDISSNADTIVKYNKVVLPVVSKDEIAYVIFTSGSTGKPKGVTITHTGAVNTIIAINEEYNINSEDAVLALSDLSFDLSVYDIFGILSVGGRIVFPDQKKLKDTNHWLELLKIHKISIWNTVPQLAEILINTAGIEISYVRLFLLSGDFIPVNLPLRIKNINNNTKVISLGGATECSIWSVWFEIKEIKEEWKTIPYGIALPNQKVYVANPRNIKEFCPFGAKGELLIGGSGVALNYWNDADKTQKSFIHNDKFGGLYRTGDIVRWLPSGILEYIGRNDEQLKINGYRVDLGDIESNIAKFPGIKQCKVIVNHINNVQLIIAHYTSNKKIKQNELADFLSKKLPFYMIPRDFIYLDDFPLTQNGKLDIKELPTPKYSNVVQHVNPRNENENNMVEIWAELLSIDKNQIGIKHDFFQLGVDSIKIMKLVSRTNRLFNSYLKITDIYSHRTIESLIPRVIELKKDFEIMVKLNDTYNKNNLFMIHPGRTGCEVYINLAKSLEGYYSCYGIDSYNLYNDKKIDNLEDLALYYLSQIQLVMKQTKQSKYYLLGWSLGGLICLKIAELLEKKGINNIFVCLIDTILLDNYLLELVKKIDVASAKLTLTNYMRVKGYDETYIKKCADILPIELSYNIQGMNIYLTKSKLVLFKAMLMDKENNLDGANKDSKEYIAKLNFNNVNSVVPKTSKIDLVEIDDAHHYTVMRIGQNKISKFLKSIF